MSHDQIKLFVVLAGQFSIRTKQLLEVITDSISLYYHVSYGMPSQMSPQ